MEKGEKGSGDSGSKGRRELETLILQKVGDVCSSIDSAKHVGDVICALHSLAVHLFPVNSSLLTGSLDERYRNQVLDTTLPSNGERDDWRHAFYHGAAFPAISRILIYNVASDWLACFPLSARKQVYDSFFVEGPSTEIVQVLVPALTRHGPDKDVDRNAVCLNTERLLVLCLIENEGGHQMVGEFGLSCRVDQNADQLIKPDKLTLISRVPQLLASIPDKARLESSSALSSHVFFHQIVAQLLVGAEEIAVELYNRMDTLDIPIADGTFLFVGETFSRICRRGSADILLGGMIPRILDHVRSCLSSNVDSARKRFESKPESLFWLRMIEAIKDQYAVERLSEELLRQLANKNVSNLEAYWILWMLFNRSFSHQTAIRAMFINKFLLWKVFPICCLRWILQFSVLECPPCSVGQLECQKPNGFLDTLQRLVSIWSKREFVQSSPMEQQAYLTAAVGLCVERMSKEQLETTKDILHSILQGVSCRLESPIHLVRKMASSIALVFSKVVDPKNPLYLDDDCCETVDWEFGFVSRRKETSGSHSNDTSRDEPKFSLRKENNCIAGDERKKDVKDQIAHGKTKFSEFSLVDPDEVVDPAMLNSQHLCDEEDDDESKSDTSSDSSLQPYDLSDDDTDLQKKFSQLADIGVALRKPDDPDSVERALDVAERLIRASPDELHHNTGDLVRALVHVRCSDVTIEGDEDSAEGKRQKALIALLVTCPFESLDVLTKLLYSPNVDVSQRILIIDVMTEAAQELADAKTMRIKHQQDLISTISGSQPWYMPSNRGPPGAGPWKEVLETGSSLSWSHRYEREIPSKPGQIKRGKSRRWSLGRAKDPKLECSRNKFPLYSAAFMLPAMQGFDKRRHGVDFLNRDFIVLGKLIYMLGVCMKCMAMHPEASALAPALLDMLSSRVVSHHAEAYVRRSVLFTASCILVALHPSYLASALIEGDQEISKGLEWIRTWALYVAESDPDTECSSMAMACLQLHAEMALQTSRSLESAECFKGKTTALASKRNDIIIPPSNIGFQV